MFESLALRASEQAARALSDKRRKLAQDALDESVRSSVMADSLWASAARSDAYRYAVRAFEKTIEVVRATSTLADAGDIGVHEVLVPLVGEKEAQQIAITAKGLVIEPPELDRELADYHGQLFVALQEANAVLRNKLETRVLSVFAIGRVRRTRRAFAAVVTLAVLVGLGWLFYAPSRSIEVTASGFRIHNRIETWPPENAIDGDEMTYWHLPPGESGWIDIALEPPRYVRAVRIMNAHDLHADDNNRQDRRRFQHASREISVAAFSGSQRVALHTEELPQLTDFTRVTAPIDSPRIDRIRVWIETWHGEGGGLAEIEVLE